MNFKDINFENKDSLETFLTLKDFVQFNLESLSEMEECYHQDFNPISRKIIKDYLYEYFFDYYAGCQDLHSLLVHSSDANEKILEGVLNEILSSKDILNKFDNYYP